MTTSPGRRPVTTGTHPTERTHDMSILTKRPKTDTPNTPEGLPAEFDDRGSLFYIPESLRDRYPAEIDAARQEVRRQIGYDELAKVSIRMISRQLAAGTVARRYDVVPAGPEPRRPMFAEDIRNWD